MIIRLATDWWKCWIVHCRIVIFRESVQNPGNGLDFLWGKMLWRGDDDEDACCCSFLFSFRARFSCLISCFERWSDLTNRRPHTEQPNFFSPVWARRWRDNSSERAKRRPQSSTWHLYGRSPEQKRKIHLSSFITLFLSYLCPFIVVLSLFFK